MKVAIVHDYIKEYGGAERVLEVLKEVWPEAPVFTSVYLPEYLGPHRDRFEGWDIRTSWLQKIPFKQKLISPFRLVAPFVFKGMDLSDYDVVIVSATGAYNPNFVRTKLTGITESQPYPLLKGEGDRSGAIQICYCHTPPRYLYGYATARDWKRNPFFAVLGEIANHFLRMVDFVASRNVDFYVANSKEVAGRIEKFYRREASVIYPPVETPNYKFQNSKILNGKYYLTGGRLARAKHVDLIVKACEELGVKLKVFGKGFVGYDSELRIKNLEFRIEEGKSEVEFLGEVSDVEKEKLMRGARAFIFAGEDEDFGIVPVEAMGAGLPVIAYKSGGVRESVVDGKTGFFFEELSVESLKGAIRKLEKTKIRKEDCIARAKIFDKKRFKREINEFVNLKFSELIRNNRN